MCLRDLFGRISATQRLVCAVPLKSGDWRQILAKFRRSVLPREPGAAALPLVAIVGRPNVGKSTLFNRLTKSRRSIVGDESGITRDRIYGEYEWAGRQFRLVDTGGIVPDDPELIPTEIYNQAKVALEEADALVLVVDARTELASPDYDLVRLLLHGGKPLFLAVNKVEGEAMAYVAENFRQLGIQPHPQCRCGGSAQPRRPRPFEQN